MVYTKHYLRQWEKERLIEEVISLKKANDSLANKMMKASDYLEKADKCLVFN
jgi:hypothetical protein